MYRALIVILLFLVSCDGKPDVNMIPEAPSNLLEQEKFTQIIVDTQLLEATLKLKLIRKNDIHQRIQGYYDQIFEKHQVTEETFRNSYDYYALQAQKFVEIHDSVEVRLIRLKDKLETNPESKKESQSSSSDSTSVQETPGKKP